MKCFFYGDFTNDFYAKSDESALVELTKTI